MRKEWTHMSLSFVTSAILRDIVTRTKYLHTKRPGGQRQTLSRGEMHNAPQLDVDALVALILFLDVLKQKVERLGLAQFARGRELL